MKESLKIIKRFVDDISIAQGKGKFDNYCVYIVKQHETKIAPKDIDLFSFLIKESRIYGKNKLYKDFVKIYNFTNVEVKESDLIEISELSKTYNLSNINDIDRIFTILYLAMIAENNKANTKLGKKIKRLGVYQSLILDYPPEKAANFSCGKDWKSLYALCEQYGF